MQYHILFLCFLFIFSSSLNAGGFSARMRVYERFTEAPAPMMHEIARGVGGRVELDNAHRQDVARLRTAIDLMNEYDERRILDRHEAEWQDSCALLEMFERGWTTKPEFWEDRIRAYLNAWKSPDHKKAFMRLARLFGGIYELNRTYHGDSGHWLINCAAYRGSGDMVRLLDQYGICPKL